MKPLRIGVAGGGVTGLTAALRLAQSGHRVTVCEQASEPGGLAAAVPFAGTRLEAFYHHVFTSDRETVRLIRELGLENRMQWRKTPMGMYSQGALYKFGTPWDLLRFRPLSFFNRLRFGLVILYLSRVKRWERYERVTAQEWIRRAFGEQAWQKVWGPLLNGKFGDYASEIGMPWFYSRVHTRAASREKGMTRESLGYLEGSFQVLHEALVKAIESLGGEVRFNEAVKRVVVGGERVQGWVTSRRARESLDAVLLTPAPEAALALLPKKLNGGYWEKLRNIQYLGNVCVILTLRRSLTPIYWMNIPDTKSPFIAVIEHTNFIPPEVYGGRHLLYLSSYLPVTHPRYRAPEAGLLDEFYAYLKKVIPDFSSRDVTGAQVFRAPYAQPVIRAGYAQNVVPAASPVAGLYLTNMAQIYPEDRGMSYSIRLGEAAAQAIKENF